MTRDDLSFSSNTERKQTLQSRKARSQSRRFFCVQLGVDFELGEAPCWWKEEMGGGGEIAPPPPNPGDPPLPHLTCTSHHLSDLKESIMCGTNRMVVTRRAPPLPIPMSGSG